MSYDRFPTERQPPPTPGAIDVWPLVINDVHVDFPGDAAALTNAMQSRADLGRLRYGTPLQTHNGRDAEIDAAQEALDLCVYLRQAIAEGKTYLWPTYRSALRIAFTLDREIARREGGR